MRVLIVEGNDALAAVWRGHLDRLGHEVVLATDEADAIRAIRFQSPDVIVMNLVLNGGSALSISDFAGFLRPQAQIIFVTNSSFFSDGSIFAHAANACAFVPEAVPPDDLCAMVEYWGASVQA